jgi:Sulfotransferase family
LAGNKILKRLKSAEAGTANEAPSFYIIGAPKCGTTSLYAYLRGHPGIYMPDLKEPQFFCDDFPTLQQVKTRKKYIKLFKEAKACQLRGEASVWYLFSKTAVKNILSERPDAKFIVMLRNPCTAVLSYHNHAVISLVERRHRFQDAWLHQSNENFYPLHAYRDVYSYAEQLKRLYSLVPRRQVKVIMFEQMIENPQAEFDAVCDFLDVPHLRLKEFPAMNAARQWNSKFVTRFLLDPAPVTRRLMMFAKRCANFFGLRPIALLHKYFSVVGHKEQLSPAMQSQLIATFRDDVASLHLAFDLPVRRFWDEFWTPSARSRHIIPRPVRAKPNVSQNQMLVN